MSSEHEPGMKVYVGLWIAMICIVGLELLVTYRHMPSDLFVGLLLILAFLEAGIGVLYFMHMKFESPNLLWTLVPITLFALVMLDQIWPDALRLARLNMWR